MLAVTTTASLVAVLVAVAAGAVKVTDVAKLVTAKDHKGVLSQVAAWAAGFGGIVAASASSLATHLQVTSGTTLGSAPITAKLLLGVGLASAGSIAVDFRKALDNTDTSKMPSWFGKARNVVDKNVPDGLPEQGPAGN